MPAWGKVLLCAITIIVIITIVVGLRETESWAHEHDTLQPVASTRLITSHISGAAEKRSLTDENLAEKIMLAALRTPVKTLDKDYVGNFPFLEELAKPSVTA